MRSSAVASPPAFPEGYVNHVNYHWRLRRSNDYVLVAVLYAIGFAIFFAVMALGSYGSK